MLSINMRHNKSRAQENLKYTYARGDIYRKYFPNFSILENLYYHWERLVPVRTPVSFVDIICTQAKILRLVGSPQTKYQQRTGP